MTEHEKALAKLKRIEEIFGIKLPDDPRAMDWSTFLPLAQKIAEKGRPTEQPAPANDGGYKVEVAIDWDVRTDMPTDPVTTSTSTWADAEDDAPAPEGEPTELYEEGAAPQPREETWRDRPPLI